MNNYSNFMSNPDMQVALRNSSVSAEDARLRGLEYAKMFSRNEDMFGTNVMNANLLQKSFSGYAETPLLSTQYFNASVASYVSSFAGYMSIERDFDQPNGLFYWFDVLGVTDHRMVLPNLGPDSYGDVQVMGTFEHEVTPSGVNYNETLGRKIIPGSVRVKVNDPADRFELVDNGNGELLGAAGKIGATATINYLNGQIIFDLGAAPAAGSTITIVGREDTTGVPSGCVGVDNGKAADKRFFAKMQQIALGTVPDLLMAEYNIAALGAMKKATGSDMATFLFTKLRELYTKCINGKLVNMLENGYTGNTMTDLDLSGAAGSTIAGFHDYRSRIDIFDNYLINVETGLATKAVKGVTTTAYVVGNRAANQFQKGSTIGKFERNTKMTYINDLLGWYDGVPVLRSTDITEATDEGTFYAIHKTADGQMAPLARGIYMPLTDTPTVGNYHNPTQMAQGIYYQEGVRYMAPELVQRVTFKVGL